MEFAEDSQEVVIPSELGLFTIQAERAVQRAKNEAQELGIPAHKLKRFLLERVEPYIESRPMVRRTCVRAIVVGEPSDKRYDDIQLGDVVFVRTRGTTRTPGIGWWWPSLFGKNIRMMSRNWKRGFDLPSTTDVHVVSCETDVEAGDTESDGSQRNVFGSRI